ncbi:MAG TPA: cupin domain-containing protein [Blastocatellia bacterium]|jgi:mannose-6-phosphate isomerase-like protein (cupin superfamily)|nr:cupin domain-containing protein [Blastocatellia bacterium]
MNLKSNQLLAGVLAMLVLAAVAASQSSPGKAPGPVTPSRPFVVFRSQTLADLESRLKSENKTEDLIAGEGLQMRIAVQHSKGEPAPGGEAHDKADDIYYVVDGSATLTIGGRLDEPKEIQPGEWRGPRIIGGQTVQAKKGDLIMVPRGTPHQRSTTGQDYTIILIKVLADPVGATKP